MGRTFQLAGLCVVILVVLGYGIQNPGLAGVLSDRVSGAHAQDETTYASSAVGVATGSGWMTPKVLGRFYLVKPPLLIWLSGLSPRTFGISRFSLRLPVLLAGALATLLLALWSARSYSRWTGAFTALLLVSDPLWQTFSRICYTDMLLVMATDGALYIFDRDPQLEQSRNIFLFGGFIAFGIMAKNVAGCLPLAVVLLYCAIVRTRPPLRNLMKSGALAAVLVAPWHLYQVISHPRWFWTDYVQIQLLQFGVKPPVQISEDGPLWYYLKRLVLTDPLLVILSLIALPFLIRAIRSGNRNAALLLAWIAVAAGSLFLFRYRNVPYLLYAIPPLCYACAAYALPRLPVRRSAITAALAIIFCLRAVNASEPWGLPFGSGQTVTSAKWFRWYAVQQRPNELIAIDPDDEYYATALRLPRIRYCYLDPGRVVQRYAPRYAFLGITVSAAQFDNLDNWIPQFRQRLLRWGLASTEPIATNISAPSVDDILRLVETHPESDFYVSTALMRRLPAPVLAGRRLVPLSRDRCFLLAANAGGSEVSRGRWDMPNNW